MCYHILLPTYVHLYHLLCASVWPERVCVCIEINKQKKMQKMVILIRPRTRQIDI